MGCIKINGVEYEPNDDPKAIAVDMWYDRHRREWVIYPVDADGNQLAEARYGFSKQEAQAIKADIEEEYEI